jgi:hypothetical protein
MGRNLEVSVTGRKWHFGKHDKSLTGPWRPPWWLHSAFSGKHLWFQAKRKRFGILLAKGHDGRVEILRINPGSCFLGMLVHPGHTFRENTVFQ